MKISDHGTGDNESSTTESSHQQPRQSGWWWRRLVFARFVHPSEESAQITPHEYETVGPDSDWLASQLPSKALFINEREPINHMFGQWKDQTERAAFNYELLRRHPKYETFHEFPVWPEISQKQWSSIVGILAPKRMNHFIMSHPPETDPTWSDPMLPWQFDLEAGDETILKEFKCLIEAQRSLKAVKAKPHSKKYKKPRDVSWRPIELHDIGQTRQLMTDEEETIRAANNRFVAAFGDLPEKILTAWNSAIDDAANPTADAANDSRSGRNPIWQWIEENRESLYE